MDKIQMQSVISSNISQVGFDSKSGTMRIKFTSGGTYDAVGTTQADFDAFLTAKSKGIHFNKILKKAFIWNKITKEDK